MRLFCFSQITSLAKSLRIYRVTTWQSVFFKIKSSAVTYLSYTLVWGVFHMLPEWPSLWNEFNPSPYVSLNLLTWCWNNISFPYKSFRNDFIPNEILFLCSVGRVVRAYLIWRKRKRIWLGRLIVSCEECGTTFILGWNSFRNESHSGVMSTAP